MSTTSCGILLVVHCGHHVSLCRTEHAIPHSGPNKTVCCMVCCQPSNTHMSSHRTQHTIHGQFLSHVCIMFLYFFVLLSPVLFAVPLLVVMVCGAVMYYSVVLHQVHQCPSDLSMKPSNKKNTMLVQQSSTSLPEHPHQVTNN